jgi:ribosomal protein L40E
VVPTHPTPDASSLRPWQFFTLLALLSATAAVVIIRGSSPANVILICLAIGAAALVGMATLRMLKPLVSPDAFEAEMVGSRTRAALEREKNLVLRSIKELEFDHAMAKVSDVDFEEMTARLRSRAVRLLRQLDSTETGYREIIERELAARLVKAGGAKAEALGHQSEPEGAEAAVAQGFSPGVCGTCDTPNDVDAKFCKQCGTKLLLIILAVLTMAGAAWAQGGGIQMPDPKQMAGIPRPVTDLPEGHVSVRLIRGQLSNNIPDFPVEMHAGDKVTTVKTDENGRAEFSGMQGGTPVKFVAVVDGERLESQEFPAPSQGGIRLMLVATLKGAAGAAAAPLKPQTGTVVFGNETRVIMDIADDTLQIYYLLDVQNSAGVPVSPATPLIMDVPEDAQGTALLGKGPVLVTGNRVSLTGPFSPGQTPIQVGFTLPHSSGDVTLTQKLPVSTGTIAVLMKKVGEMGLASTQFPQIEERQFQGETYVLAQAPPQAAGTTLTLNISGLPHHSPVPHTIALVLAFMIAGTGLWAAVKVPQQGVDAARLKQLKSKREKIFADLIRLEQQRRSGTVDASRYAERRPALMAQLERVYRDLDTEGGQGLAA